jgi:hypothetical protein
MVVPILHSCATQKLLYADAIALVHPQNAAEAPTMEYVKPLQLGGRDGPGLCSIQQDRKHQAAIYARFAASGDVPAAPELCGPLAPGSAPPFWVDLGPFQ